MKRATAGDATAIHDPTSGAPDGRRLAAVPDSYGSLPRLPRVYVHRTALWQRLDEATANPVTLLVGPMGAGKTLGVSGWAQHTRPRGGVRWMHGDAGLGPEALAAALNEAMDEAAGDAPRLLIVDDAHLLPAATLRFVDERLDRAPESIRLLLLARWDLPITRLGPELLGHFTVLRGELLRLSRAESATLVAEHARTDSPEVARIIADRTQGWCGAVVLTARAVGNESDRLAAARRYESQDTVVADGVASEVFASLQPRERHLVLCIANEETVTAETAAHLSHNPGAGQVLAGLETTGLLVTHIGSVPTARPPEDSADDGAEEEGGTADGRTARYRIHPLMAEVVRRRIAAGGVDVDRAKATVLRAVRLDVARGDSRGAFRRLVAMNLPEEAAELLTSDGHALLMHGDHAAMRAFARRYPQVVDAHPGTWFCLALERWFHSDVDAAAHWMDRLLHALPAESASDGQYDVQVACVHLMRSRVGLEPPAAAAADAQTLVSGDLTVGTPRIAMAHMLGELGVTQAWLGRLDLAEENLTNAVRLSNAWNMPVYAAVAMTHLATVFFLQGREATSLRLSQEALGLMGRGLPWRPVFAEHRAQLFVQLAELSGLPLPTSPADLPTTTGHVHPSDLTVKFWMRMRDARFALLEGSVMRSEEILRSPLAAPGLPDHLRSAALVEHGFLAALAGDHQSLDRFASELQELGWEGEASLLQGLGDDLVGDRRAAADRFAAAAESVRLQQPPCRALALACEAETRDALGESEPALDRLRTAVTITEVRRNAAPCLGWTRHGTSIHTLLHRLGQQSADPWLAELTEATDGLARMSTILGPWTASVQERSTAAAEIVPPTLSPREQDVLRELARGATYADIATLLYLSENTVKTHVSSLYAKLAVSRRSEALAVARKLDLL